MARRTPDKIREIRQARQRRLRRIGSGVRVVPGSSRMRSRAKEVAEARGQTFDPKRGGVQETKRAEERAEMRQILLTGKTISPKGDVVPGKDLPLEKIVRDQAAQEQKESQRRALIEKINEQRRIQKTAAQRERIADLTGIKSLPFQKQVVESSKRRERELMRNLKRVEGKPFAESAVPATTRKGRVQAAVRTAFKMRQKKDIEKLQKLRDDIIKLNKQRKIIAAQEPLVKSPAMQAIFKKQKAGLNKLEKSVRDRLGKPYAARIYSTRKDLTQSVARDAVKRVEGVKKVISAIEGATKQAQAEISRRRGLGFAKEVGKVIIDYPISLTRGAKKLTRLGFEAAIGGSSKDVSKVSALVRKVAKRQPYTSRELRDAQDAAGRIRLKSDEQRIKKIVTAYRDPDVANLLILLGFVAVGSGAAAIGGRVGTAVSKGIDVGADVLLTTQAVKTVKNPTAENVGELILLGGATKLYRAAKKLGPYYEPTIKNIDKAETGLKQLRAQSSKEIRALRGRKQTKAVRAQLAALNKYRDKTNKFLREIRDIRRKGGFVLAEEFNPRVTSKEVTKLMGGISDLYHVTTAKAHQLFPTLIRQEVKTISKKKISDIARQSKQLAVTKPGKGKISVVDKIKNRDLLGAIKGTNLILTGGRAQNLQLPYLSRRKSVDWDFLSNNARRTTLKVISKLNRKSKGRYKLRLGGHPGTFQIYDTKTKKIIADITQITKESGGKPPTVTIDGVKVAKTDFLLKKKYSSSQNVKRAKAKRKKDIMDIYRLTGGLIKEKDLVNAKKVPLGQMEVVSGKGRIGKDRLKFGENFLYWDLSAALGYGRSGKYTIVRYPRAKINKLPKNLQKLARKAYRGELSKKQTDAFRRQLVSYVKKQVGKILPGTRTVAMGGGEREFVSPTGTRLKTKKNFRTFVNRLVSRRVGTKYTYDDDIGKFVEVIDVGAVGKRGKKGYNFLKDFATAYLNDPILRAKYRIGQKDLTATRRYKNLMRKGPLTPKQKKGFIELVGKIARRRKRPVSKTPKRKSRTPPKKTSMRSGRKPSKITRKPRKRAIKSRRRMVSKRARPRRQIKRSVTRRAALKRRSRKVPVRSRTVSRRERRATSRRRVRAPIRKRHARRAVVRRREAPRRVPARIRFRPGPRKRRTSRARKTSRRTATKKIIPPKPSDDGKRKVKGFTPQVKVRGKWRDAYGSLLPESEARQVARSVVDQSSSASYRVIEGKSNVPITRRSRGVIVSNVPSSKFRRSKRDPNIIVEKSKYRIDSLGEKRGIRPRSHSTKRKSKNNNRARKSVSGKAKSKTKTSSAKGERSRQVSKKRRGSRR